MHRDDATRMSNAEYFVYILKCRDGSYYAGSTSDLAGRNQAHQAGKGAARTAARLPVQMRLL